MIFKPNKLSIEGIGTTEQRQVWAKALRSDNYEQHRSAMCDPTKKGSACCLHVAAIELDGIEWEDGFTMSPRGDLPLAHGTPDDLSVSAPFAMAAVVKDDCMHDENGIPYSFMEMNDGFLFTFDQIADIIEGKEVNCRNIK